MFSCETWFLKLINSKQILPVSDSQSIEFLVHIHVGAISFAVIIAWKHSVYRYFLKKVTRSLLCCSATSGCMLDDCKVFLKAFTANKVSYHMIKLRRNSKFSSSWLAQYSASIFISGSLVVSATVNSAPLTSYV